MYSIAMWKTRAVLEMTKNSFPVTSQLVKSFEQFQPFMSQDDFIEGMLILNDMFIEMKKNRSVHKMYELNGDLNVLLKRVDKKH